MANNTVTATIEFSYKGERFNPSITVELDKYLLSSGSIPNLYPLIATGNNLDLYSYEYEMMQAETILFSNAKGLIAEYIVKGVLDKTAFESAWKANRTLATLELIAEQHLGIEDLQLHPQLKQALLEAYQSGQKNPE